MNTTLRNTVNKRLAAAGASWTMPTTREGIDKRLEDIAAGKGLRRPDSAHPYPECFGARSHDHYEYDVARHGGWYRRPYLRNDYGEKLTCEDFIRAVEARKLEAEISA